MRRSLITSLQFVLSTSNLRYNNNRKMSFSTDSFAVDSYPYNEAYAASSRCIDNFAEQCEGKGLLAIDFDNTTTQIHTSGYWTGSAEGLAVHVRPLFRAMLRIAVPKENLSVAIVTFSGQIDLIKEVLVLRFFVCKSLIMLSLIFHFSD